MRRDCPVCLSSARLEAHHPETELYRCSACDHCFSDPEIHVAPEIYNREYYEVTHRNWFRNPDLPFYRRLLDLMDRHAPGASSLIDVGCGRGALLRFIRQERPRLAVAGLDLTANDPSEGIDFIQGDVFDAGTVPRTFDIVVSVAVIEHVGDVRGFLRRMFELAEPGGLVVLTTLNERSLLYEVARLMRRFGFDGPFNRLYSKHHVNHFNLRSLLRLIQNEEAVVCQTLLDTLQMKSVDIPPGPVLKEAVMRAGAWFLLSLGTLVGRAFRQTIVCHVPLSRKLPF